MTNKKITLTTRISLGAVAVLSACLGVKVASALQTPSRGAQESQKLDRVMQNLDALLVEGDRLAEQKKYDAAITRYQKVTASHWAWAQAYEKLGDAYLGKGDLENAEQQYRIAVRKMASATSYLRLSIVLGRQRKYQEAIQAFYTAAPRLPQPVSAPLQEGRFLATPRGMRKLEAYAQSGMGLEYYFSGLRIAEATKHLNEALRLEPEEPAANLMMGDLLKRQRRYKEAAPYYARAKRATNPMFRKIAEVKAR